MEFLREGCFAASGLSKGLRAFNVLYLFIFIIVFLAVRREARSRMTAGKDRQKVPHWMGLPVKAAAGSSPADTSAIATRRGEGFGALAKSPQPARAERVSGRPIIPKSAGRGQDSKRQPRDGE